MFGFIGISVKYWVFDRLKLWNRFSIVLRNAHSKMMSRVATRQSCQQSTPLLHQINLYWWSLVISNNKVSAACTALTPSNWWLLWCPLAISCSNPVIMQFTADCGMIRMRIRRETLQYWTDFNNSKNILWACGQSPLRIGVPHGQCVHRSVRYWENWY